MDTHHKTSVNRDIVSNITIPKKKPGFFGFLRKKNKSKLLSVETSARDTQFATGSQKVNTGQGPVLQLDDNPPPICDVILKCNKYGR